MREKLLALLKPQADTDLKLSVVSLYLAKAIESLSPRLESLEARQLQKGDKGEQGDSIVGPKGDKGEKGDAGPQGKSIIGPAGQDGKDGKAGAKGAQGVSVVDAEIAADDHLVLKLSNGKEVDAGALPKADGNGSVFVSGNAWQITVSATAPDNPALNQLWLDIS